MKDERLRALLTCPHCQQQRILTSSGFYCPCSPRITPLSKRTLSALWNWLEAKAMPKLPLPPKLSQSKTTATSKARQAAITEILEKANNQRQAQARKECR